VGPLEYMFLGLSSRKYFECRDGNSVLGAVDDIEGSANMAPTWSVHGSKVVYHTD